MFFFIVVDCGQLPAPIFGSISGATTYGSSVILSCRKGFSLFGSSRRTCQANGSWTGAATHCKSTVDTVSPYCLISKFFLSLVVDCGVVKSPANGQITVLNTTYGSVASFQCNSGHSLVGPSSRQCQANGQWSSIPTLCDGETLRCVHYSDYLMQLSSSLLLCYWSAFTRVPAAGFV